MIGLSIDPRVVKGVVIWLVFMIRMMLIGSAAWFMRALCLC
jgi:hypothetical protein